MRKLSLVILFALCSCTSLNKNAHRGQTMNPPVPEKIPVILEKHGDKRVDNYFWMQERENPKVLEHLKTENAYADYVLKPTESLQKQLFSELKARMKQDDITVPYKQGNYEYYARTETDKDYPIYCRKALQPGAKEEILLDGNQMAKGHDYFSIANYEVSLDGNILAYAVDTKGARMHSIYFKNLKTGEVLKPVLENMSPAIAWAADNKTIFYVQQNPETLRSEKVFRFSLETEKSELVYEEKDETFSVWIDRSLTDRYLFLTSHSELSTETRYLEANNPTGKFKIFQKREPKHEYHVDDGGDRFYIVTNWKAKNYRLMETSSKKTNKAAWKEVVKHSSKSFLQDVTVFKTDIILNQRENGLTVLRVLNRKSKKITNIPFKDPSYVAGPRSNHEYDQSFFRFYYQSMTTPESILDYDLTTGKQTLRKQDEVLGGFDSNNYESQRLMLTSHDGTKVPVSIVYRKTTQITPQTPLLITGYGAYGLSLEPWFGETRLSLLDRGFVFAITHLRGGSEMGRSWYDDGRLMKKKNTFLDFIAVTDQLHKKKISSPAHSYAMGGSAGGLLMGAILNMRPDLFYGVVTQVPFVDVITTMLDSSLPLTTFEYDQWGNPNNKKAYNYIKSYSPYDNVAALNYPSILVRTGLHDSQVPYWEPAKWVAKMRELKTSKTPVLLHTELKAGHGGKSGRFEALKDTALEYAFILGLEQGLIK